MRGFFKAHTQDWLAEQVSHKYLIIALISRYLMYSTRLVVEKLLQNEIGMLQSSYIDKYYCIEKQLRQVAPDLKNK